MPITPPVMLAPPVRWFVWLLVGFHLAFGVFVYWLSLPVVKSADVVRATEMPGLEVAWLKGEARDAELSLKEILERDERGGFVPLRDGERLPTVNEIPNQERWFRFEISPAEMKNRSAVLDADWHIYDELELYRQMPDGSWERKVAGQVARPNAPESSERWMGFDLQWGEQREVFYLKVRDYYRLPADLVWRSDPNAFLRGERLLHARDLGFFCLWAGAISYGLFLYAMVRTREQLSYVIFIALFGFVAQSGNTLSNRLLYPLSIGLEEWPAREILVSAAACLGMMSFCSFSGSFLELRKVWPLADRLLGGLKKLWLVALLALPALIWPVGGFGYRIYLMVLGILTVGSLLWACMVSWKGKQSSAPYYLLGFTPLLFAILIAIAPIHESIITNEQERLASRICTGLSLIFFSAAMAFRYRLALDEKYHLQAKYLQNLEGEVAARTRELNELNHHLEKAVEERDRILGVIGHDLRAPTSSLYFFTRILANEKVPLSREELTEMSVKIGHACTMQLELLNNLLVWGTSRYWRSPRRAEPVVLRDAVEETFRIFQSGVRVKRIGLINSVPEDLESQADPSLLQTVLRNLISNGIKFSGENGCIEVRATGLEKDQVEIRVVDQGVGIDPERLKQLFVSSGESMPGTAAERGAGIGLNLCDDIVQSMGGSIRLESRPGKGTTAIFTLPGVSRRDAHRTLHVQHRTLKC